MKKKILMIFLLGLFWIGFVSAINCNPKIKIEIGIYNQGFESDDFEKSLFQPSGFGGVVQEGDYLLIESFSFSINSSCNLEDRIVIELKKPEEDGFSSIAYLSLEDSWEESGLIKYSFELDDFAIDSLNSYKDNQGKFTICCSPKRLDIEGKWETKVLYGETKMHQTLFNEGEILSRWLDVGDRVFIAQLETLKQLRDESRDSSQGALKIMFLIGFATIILELFAIWVMRDVGKKQIKEMKKHYESQTKKEDKREEEKQISLLESLYSELETLEEDLLEYQKNVVPNLEWLPTQNIKELSSSLYIGGLSRKIKKIKTKFLKQNIININKNVDIINNQMTLIFNRRISNIKNNRDNVLNRINEIFPLVLNSKRFLKENFNVK